LNVHFITETKDSSINDVTYLEGGVSQVNDVTPSCCHVPFTYGFFAVHFGSTYVG